MGCVLFSKDRISLATRIRRNRLLLAFKSIERGLFWEWNSIQHWFCLHRLVYGVSRVRIVVNQRRATAQKMISLDCRYCNGLTGQSGPIAFFWDLRISYSHKGRSISTDLPSFALSATAGRQASTRRCKTGFFDVFSGSDLARTIPGSACVPHAVFGVPPNTFRPASLQTRPIRGRIHRKEPGKEWGARRAPRRSGRSRSPILAAAIH